MIPNAKKVRTRAPVPGVRLAEILDAPIAARLARFGLVNVADWVKLTPRQQLGFFGVPRFWVSAINAAIAGQGEAR